MFDSGFKINGIIHTGYPVTTDSSDNPEIKMSERLVPNDQNINTFVTSLKSSDPALKPLNIGELSTIIHRSIHK